jgi:TonB family protein
MRTIFGILFVVAGFFAGDLAAEEQTGGAGRLDLYFSKGFDDKAWQQAAFDQTAKAWVGTTAPALGKKSVVTANVGRDGKVTEMKLTTDSGSADWDKAAVDAVKNATPFPTLPKAWTASSLEVQFHFSFRPS